MSRRRVDASLPLARPEDVGFRPGGLAALDRLFDQALADRVFPGGVVAVGKDGAVVLLRAFGHLCYDADAPEVAPDTLYDLSSLTKVVATTTVAMTLVDEGRVALAQPVSEFVPAFRGDGKDCVTVENLLSHSAGFPDTAPLWEALSGRAAYVERVATMPLAYPPGSQSVYSDLGFVLLGEVLERASGQDLDAASRARVLDPLAMTDTLFRPGPEWRPRIAPTEENAWRGRLLQGEVHDDNAFAMGGVAGHAGLFGTAPDLLRFAQMMLDEGVQAGRRIVSADEVRRFTRRAGVPGSSRALGWDTPTGVSSAGRLMSPRAFGHTGFTGTSMWIDPEPQVSVILLTNRVCPVRGSGDAIRQVRQALADTVVAAVAAS